MLRLEKEKKAPEYVLRYAAGTHYLVYTGEGEYKNPIILNESARLIYEWLLSGKEEDEIAGLLAAEYGLKTEEVRADVDLMIKTLGEYGITAQRQ